MYDSELGIGEMEFDWFKEVGVVVLEGGYLLICT